MLQFFMLVTPLLMPAYIFRFKLLGIPTNVFEIAVLLTFIALLLYGYIARGKTKNHIFPRWRDDLLFRAFLIFCILFVLSSILGVVNAGFSQDSLGIFKSYVLTPLLLSLSIYWQLKSERVDSVVKYLLIGLYASVLVVSAIALLQRIGLVSTIFYQVGDASFQQYLGDHFRAFSIFESPNYLAMFIVPTSLIACGIINNPKVKTQNLKLWKGSFYLSLILPLLALIFSQSRAGLIAALGSLAIITVIYLYGKLNNKKQKIALVLTFIILASLFIVLVFKFAMRPEADALRFQIYHFSWLMVRENWLTGIGAGNFQDYLKSMPIAGTSISDSLSYAIHPHNLYLALWLNFGLLGLLSFSAISVWVFSFLLKSKNLSSLFILGAFCAILIHGIFDTTYFKNDLAVMYWLITSIAVANFQSKNSNL